MLYVLTEGLGLLLQLIGFVLIAFGILATRPGPTLLGLAVYACILTGAAIAGDRSMMVRTLGICAIAFVGSASLLGLCTVREEHHAQRELILYSSVAAMAAVSLVSFAFSS